MGVISFDFRIRAVEYSLDKKFTALLSKNQIAQIVSWITIQILFRNTWYILTSYPIMIFGLATLIQIFFQRP